MRARLVALGVALVVLLPLGYLWATSLVPDEYSAMEMGYADLGGGPAVPAHDANGSHGSHGGQDGTATSVADLTGPKTAKADVVVELTARRERFQLASGEAVDGFTLNGSSPGPLIRANQGDLVQVTLTNESVPDGITLHWHGIDVPNAEDGVAGVTQDAVRVGGRHVYRFRADDSGTYWYHSHQVSSEQVKGGLLGPIVIEPVTHPVAKPGTSATAKPEAKPVAKPGTRTAGEAIEEVVATVHTYDGRRTINGRTGTQRVAALAGARVRVRVINTDNAIVRTGVVGAPYRVVAVDGREIHGPTPVDDQSYLVPAGGRVDLEATVPATGGLRLDAGSAATSLIIGPGEAVTAALPERTVDLLTYGAPAPVGLDPARPDRRFEYRIGRRAGFLDGVPGLWWTINGKQFPDVPMYLVAENDVVRMRITNDSGQTHPMHLHGHHAVVLSRNGKPAIGSPWWVDSLEVADGESFEVAFLADNPGIWMDHCHNLPHAAQGLVAHLAYGGVTTPYRIGGDHRNEPE